MVLAVWDLVANEPRWQSVAGAMLAVTGSVIVGYQPTADAMNSSGWAIVIFSAGAAAVRRRLLLRLASGSAGPNLRAPGPSIHLMPTRSGPKKTTKKTATTRRALRRSCTVRARAGRRARRCFLSSATHSIAGDPGARRRGPSYVRGTMNRRQQRRQVARRKHHAETTRTTDRPAVVLSQETYTRVENAHIVPRMYQHAWATNGQVAVHEVGKPGFRRVSTRKAGTRPAYYRRKRPKGEEIDDIEACLAYVENRATPPLRELIGGAKLTPERKGGLAQFIAVQMLRGPEFFEQRDELLRPRFDALEEKDFKPQALEAAGGDLEKLKSRVTAAYLGPTKQFETMLVTAPKIASVLGVMRWELIELDDPVLAYSDHPVVLWPLATRKADKPFERQELGPLGALEVRSPLSPKLGLLMTWVDRSDRRLRLPVEAAEEFNAFTIAQADQEWMHQPGHEPPIATGPHYPLARMTERGYNAASVESSQRRAKAQQFRQGNRHRKFINDIEVLVDIPGR